jgi:hypothetical protein
MSQDLWKDFATSDAARKVLSFYFIFTFLFAASFPPAVSPCLHALGVRMHSVFFI